MDDLPVEDASERPRPRLPTLTLLVGRITTIKLSYWALLTVSELALGLRIADFEPRFPWSLVAAAVLTAGALGWAAWAARAVDPRLGGLERSGPAIATAFIAASVVATPASLPLLLIEIQRAGEGCARGICHWEAVWYWVAAVAIGTALIPLVFGLRMRSAPDRQNMADHTRGSGMRAASEVRLIRAGARRAGGVQTPGMLREEAFDEERLWIGTVRTQPNAASGWHHHGERDTYVYVISGSARVEFGRGGLESAVAGPDDFLMIPRGVVHREVNPEATEAHAVVVRVGEGQIVFNVDGPEPS